MLHVAESAALSDRGRVRSGNEDRFIERRPLFAIADGMGGARAGEVASRTAADVLRNGLPEGPGSAEERLAAMVREANRRVHALAQDDAERAGMGTTLTVAYLGEDDLAIAHVGDSRMYCLRDGLLEQRTHDHSLVGEMVRRGQLSPEEAEDHPQRSIITRAIGPEEEVAVDHETWAAREGDLYLLCSDGLTDMIPDGQVEAILAVDRPLADTARALIDAANEAGGRDNITVVLFRVGEVALGLTADEPTTELASVTASPGPDTFPGTDPSAVPDALPGSPKASAAPEPPDPLDPRRQSPAPAPAGRRRRGRRIAPLVVLVILLAVVASAGWIASRGVYFVGTDDQGFVTLYQGVPYELPGFKLYQSRFETGMPVSEVPAGVRRTVTKHELRSYDDAVDLVRQIERGTLVEQATQR
jgi:serine/threonine protein phosphatase PrpC